MMKATHKWIESYVGSGLDAVAMAERLTMAGTEVEHMEAVGDDTCFTLEVTSNRVDCLGVLGLARELAASVGKTAALPEATYPVSKAKAAEVSSVAIEPDALAACPHYTAQIIRGVKVGPSPAWLRARLEAIGLKPVNNIVDVTNFVLYETGQPLHAFDLNKLAGKKIIVRMARDKEQFRPIADRKQRASIALDARTLVIADAQKPQAVAGVMGGAESEVGVGTTDILLESAYFEPQSNKATGRRLELESDSAYRFSRGVDVGGVVWASRRAAKLIVEIAGGEVLDGILEAGAARVEARSITVSESQVQRVLGERISAAQMGAIFGGLGLISPKADGENVTVGIPSFRRDLVQPVDLIEEVGRIHGLGRIPAPLRMTVSIAKPTRRQRARAEVRRALMGQGFSEALTDTFVTDKGDMAALGESPARLEARSPVNAALPALRRNLVQSLLLAVGHNERQGNPGVRLFEVAHVFQPATDGKSTGEREVVGIAAPSFLEAKGAIEGLLESLRISDPLRFEPHADPALAPGRAARLMLGGKPAGLLAQPAPATLKQADCEAACGLAELDFEALCEAWVETPKFAELPRFPTAERDLAFVLEAATPWAQVEAAVRKACDATLRDVKLFDEFRGKAIGAGKKSLAFRLYFRNDERTLTADEISAQMNAAIEAVTRIGGVLRG